MAILTTYWCLDVALVFFTILMTAYLYMTRNFNYWAKRNVFEARPTPFVGNLLEFCLLRKTSGEHFATLYEQAKDLPYLGIYIFDKPALLLRDPEIIKSVMMKNADSFSNRHVGTHDSDPIASANLLLMKNPKWKTQRYATSHIFTANKMRGMFQLLLEIGDNLVTHLDNLNLPESGQTLDVKELSARFTTDVITTCAFGLQVDSLNDPESQFRQCGVDIFGFSTLKRSIELAIFFFAPNIAKLLNLKFFSTEGSNFMRSVIMKTLALRMESKICRNDLIDMLIELKAKDPEGEIFTDDNLVGQAATFFAAGFESSSTTMGFTLYELALQPDLQTRLREEIVSALEENGGEITYEMVMNLPYLDMVISETLRRYPSLPFLDRVADWDFEVPDTGLVIEKDTPVYMPLLGLHNDPQYFPDPDKYDPERFSKENKKKLPSCVYMPFGEGPHACIGLRFGLMQSKLGVLKFILNHEIVACAETPIPITLDPKGTLVVSKGGIPVNIRKI